MKKWVLLLFMLLIACAPQPPMKLNETVNASLPSRIIEEKIIVQCWDNSTADSITNCPVREQTSVVVEEPKRLPIAKKLLSDAKTKFSTYAYLLDDRLVIASSDRVRHLFLKLGRINASYVTDVYVDLENKTARAYCNVEREGEIFDDAFDWSRSRCKELIDVPVELSFDDWLPYGPLQYLERFQTDEPILVEDNLQTISIGGTSKSIQPSIHYMVDGKRVILRIDKRYQVPLKIEREGQNPIDFRDIFFDVMVVYGKQQKITADWFYYKNVSEYWRKGNTH